MAKGRGGRQQQELAIHEHDIRTDEAHTAHDDSRGPLDESGRTTLLSDESDEEELEQLVAEDIQKFEESFRGISKHYRLINRIGEGTFSTVYKAEDLRYQSYENEWDREEEENRCSSPARKPRHTKPKARYVAIKKIYVTSSPIRIYNELELLHDLRDSNCVCPLITAFRHQDQVIAILPFFRHLDFRDYFQTFTVADMRWYFRSLFTALAAVHGKLILHRDIKPTNFLYDIHRRTGVLVDFGLAERAATDYSPCICELSSEQRAKEIRWSYAHRHGLPQIPSYPKEDGRPSRRANRAGTRGFRAPEVLLKCTAQTPKIDVWSAGVILLTILTRRFPFFASADDIDAMIELATVFGRTRMKMCALQHGEVFESNLPTISDNGYSFEKIILWSLREPTRGPDGKKPELPSETNEAVEFLNRCLDFDVNKRISAAEALEHPFLRISEEVGSEDGHDVEMHQL